MKGGKNRQPLGYTIVEVMVVLAISGVMFLIAAQFINGKQQRASFTSGVNDTASQIQDVIEQVTDGKYSDIPLGCSAPSGVPTFGAPSPAGQGTNADCVFIGKIFQFQPPSPDYIISSLAGARSDGTVTQVIDLGPNSVNPTVIPGLDISQTTPQSLILTHSLVTDNAGVQHPDDFIFGFIQGLGTSNGAGIKSGAQTVSLVYSTQAGPFTAPTQADLHPASSIVLCLSDGNPGSQVAKLVIGGASSQLGVDVQRGVPCP